MTAFTLGDDQIFRRVGSETKPTKDGRTVKVTVWQTNCPDCGTAFNQYHRDVSFVPGKTTTRRCPACRDGTSRRVKLARNAASPIPRSPYAGNQVLQYDPVAHAGIERRDPATQAPAARPVAFHGNPWTSPPPQVARAARPDSPPLAGRQSPSRTTTAPGRWRPAGQGWCSWTARVVIADVQNLDAWPLPQTDRSAELGAPRAAVVGVQQSAGTGYSSGWHLPLWRWGRAPCACNHFEPFALRPEQFSANGCGTESSSSSNRVLSTPSAPRHRSS
jgi:hypothetical protein